jgi:tRNA (guanine37-N1)-methyltransferase
MLRFEVVTLFPELVHAATAAGVLGRAIERGLVAVGTEDPRGYAPDAHRTVDDRPYGGGPGMVLKPEPFAQAIEAAARRLPAGTRRIALSAQGRPLLQQEVRRMAAEPGLLLVAGRYEGFDERLVEREIDEELSIGDYVLSGGEFAALVVIDAVTRLVPGVLGDGQRRPRAHPALAAAAGAGPDLATAAGTAPGARSRGRRAAVAGRLLCP